MPLVLILLMLIFGIILGGSIKESLWNCLHSYLGSCLINDQEKIKVLRLLVEFWGQCLILGFKDDEPETLIVVCS